MTAHGYQYVVLRCVPRADREESLNLGVVLYCQQLDFLDCAAQLDASRLAVFGPQLDVDSVASALAAIQAVCRGEQSAAMAGALPIGARFGWLSAPRSTVVRPGPIHGGVSAEPAAELIRLLAAEVG